MKELEGVEKGDIIFTAKNGEELVVGSQGLLPYKISTIDASYTLDGLYDEDDKYPTAWREKPEWYQIPQHEYKRGDKVICIPPSGQELKRYVSHTDENFVHCYVDGQDEFTANGASYHWSYDEVRLWEGNK